MFDSIKNVADSVGSVFRTIPAAARISNDVENGRQPSQQDLFIMGLMNDFNRDR
ncbi:hypothetical protein [uncultured Cohaesibacter sp.]|uniref:hypothetical protein n=1 Tax=uncultured Cohaesibacter sp. TaxID=1002546 RepID=UPI00292CFF1F|nr:hypothetical protein [uncultured Cohaesibacter sp.]